MESCELMKERRFNTSLILCIAQGAYSGRVPFAPGTAGSLVAVLLYLPLAGLPSGWYFFACIFTVAVAIWTANEAEKLVGQKDAPSIVIDEIAGYLIAMTLLPSNWVFIGAGFLLFRVFDIIKPFPLKRLQDLHGGMGIVLDDVGAGIYTNIVLHIAAFLLRAG